MSYGEAFLYGMVQGLTEYLPISSSAHLILLPRFLGREDPGLAFDIFLHLGTLFSTLVYFWRHWFDLIKELPLPGLGFGRVKLGKGLWEPIALATVPALFAGALLGGYAETVFRGSEVLVWTLPLGGVALWAVDHWASRKRDFKEIGLKEAVIIGVFQCIALIPGVSRSGATITGGRFLGFDRESSARFSFLISAPVTAAAVVYSLKDWHLLATDSVGVGPMVLAFLSSFLFGWVAIDGLLRLLRRFGYLSFAIYRVLLGILIWKVLV